MMCHCCTPEGKKAQTLMRQAAKCARQAADNGDDTTLEASVANMRKAIADFRAKRNST